LLLGLASAARVPDLVFSSEDAGEGGLKSARTWLTMMRAANRRGGRSRGGGEEEEEMGLMNRMFTVKFYCPPSLSDEFEKRWMELEDQEKESDMLTLKSSEIDNYNYYSYGEFKSHDCLHEHMMSDHFNDFAEWVDDHGITWEMCLLNDMSHDVEEQQHRHTRRSELSESALATLPNKGLDASEEQLNALYAALAKRKGAVHAIFKYRIQPGKVDVRDFVDSWRDMALSTTKEKGNHFVSLRNVATDNTHMYGYGCWESMSDYLDHLQSRHLGKFLDYVDDKDVLIQIIPVKNVE